MAPKIAIISSALRPQNWMNLYKSLGNNDIEFELVFVGPNPPDYELPANFRFIRSMVKPSQCFEIAARNTTTDLIMNIADDCEFKTPEPLDKLYDCYKSYDCDKVIVSSRMMTNGEDQSHFAHRFFTGDDSSPVMPLCSFMSKQLYFDLGGIDRNFIAVMWDLDMAMRVYALGGKVVLSDVFLNEDTDKSAGSHVCNEFWRHDRALLEHLWAIDGKVHFDRRQPVESFSDINILTVSQGPRGRWRGSGLEFLEKVQDCLVRVNRAVKTPSMYPYYIKKIAMRLKG